MVVETLLCLGIGWSHFGLATNNNALYTFSFLMLLYFAAFSIVSARERHWFWATLPSKTFLSAIAVDVLFGTILTRVGLPGLMPLPWIETFMIFRLCNGLVPCHQRRRQGRDDQMESPHCDRLESNYSVRCFSS